MERTAKWMLKVEIIDDDLRELILEGKNPKGRYRKLSNDRKFVEKLTNIYTLMCSVENVLDLKEYSFLHYEKLKFRDMSSVRIFNHRVERLLFTEMDGGIRILLIEINEDHYGNKK